MLHLAKDGIFPITKDKDGKLLKELPASGLHVAGTIQGEGKLNGIPPPLHVENTCREYLRMRHGIRCL